MNILLELERESFMTRYSNLLSHVVTLAMSVSAHANTEELMCDET